MNHAVDLAKNIDNLKKEKAQVEYEIDTLMEVKKVVREGTGRTQKKILQNPLKTTPGLNS